MIHTPQPCTHIIIIQAPLVQLNTPYPSGAYLQAFFKQLKTDFPQYTIGDVRWIDMSIALFHRIFSTYGMQYIFEHATKNNFTQPFFCQKDAWITWIDTIVQIVCGDERELCHEFVRSPHVPRGRRMLAYMVSIDREVSVDDARFLASLAIEDIADFIHLSFDAHFSLVHYAESLATSTTHFSDIEKVLESPVLTVFLKPLITELCASLEQTKPDNETFLFCLSTPFPGTVSAALYMSIHIKEHFQSRAVCSLGGGYVNTELRNVKTSHLYKYIDILSYDRGYASYYAFFESKGIFNPIDTQTLYHLASETSLFVEYENRITRTLTPDYSGIDFSAYPRLCDTTNPMHRLWSDGTWLKAYLAHGCYWHRCAFCDVTLDYVCKYTPVDTEHLYRSLSIQATQHKRYGIHFVDEAAPPRALRDFALHNTSNTAREGRHKLTFWGNIRFEKTFCRDLTDLLSYSGMTGVTGGIEIATADGLQTVDKGTDIASLVAACAAFKESGILVHAYLIYGYWNETAQQLIDSAETLRQMFAHGLLDSAFWHKFVLTRHSRLFAEWKQGMHTALKPLTHNDTSGDFAQNDIRFEGEKQSERYTHPLDSALDAWMSGEELNKPIQQWFPFETPKPSISRTYINSFITAYEKRREGEFSAVPIDGQRFLWIGGYPYADKKEVVWIYMGEELSLHIESTSQAHNMAKTLTQLKEHGVFTWNAHIATQVSATVFCALRGKGLCRIL